MSNISSMVGAVVNAKIIDTLCSKIEGRHNWTIRIDDTHFRAGGYGRMTKRWGQEYLWYMAEHHTSWLHFTYKKDYLTAIHILLDAGYEQYPM